MIMRFLKKMFKALWAFIKSLFPKTSPPEIVLEPWLQEVVDKVLADLGKNPAPMYYAEEDYSGPEELKATQERRIKSLRAWEESHLLTSSFLEVMKNKFWGHMEGSYMMDEDIIRLDKAFRP